MKKAEITVAEAVGILLVLFVLILGLNNSGTISNLIQSAVGLFTNSDANNLNPDQSKPSSQAQKDIKGELGPILIIKMNDQLAKTKPTSPDYCLVGTSIKNTGKDEWTSAEKLKVSLFCRYDKNQLKDTIYSQNYPAINDYVDDLKQGEEKNVIFASRFPNNCLKSLDKYYIILYSNCEGAGTESQPCNNFNDVSKPAILSKKEFICKID